MRPADLRSAGGRPAGRGGGARFAPHLSFEDRTGPRDILPRDSTAIGMLVFHDRSANALA